MSARISRRTQREYGAVNKPGLTIRDTLPASSISRIVRRGLNRQYANMIAFDISGTTWKVIFVGIEWWRMVLLTDKDFISFILK